jgi:hypothetical protein
MANFSKETRARRLPLYKRLFASFSAAPFYLFEGAFAGRQFYVAQLAPNMTSSPQLGLAIGTIKMVTH